MSDDNTSKQDKLTNSNKSDSAITKTMTIGEIISKFPETINVFFEHGLHCVGCAGAAFETLEQGAEMHGVDSDKLVAELNDLVYKIQQIQKKDKLNTSKNLK